MVEEVNLVNLRALYGEHDSAKAVLDHFASRERNRKTTTIDRIYLNLSTHVSRGDIIWVFRELENCGCGKFVVGRRGQPSRFEWSVEMVGVGQAAAGETDQFPGEVSLEDEREENGDNDFFEHKFHLRRDLSVTIELPTDLTPQEAARMSRFIETLPLN